MRGDGLNDWVASLTDAARTVGHRLEEQSAGIDQHQIQPLADEVLAAVGSRAAASQPIEAVTVAVTAAH